MSKYIKMSKRINDKGYCAIYSSWVAYNRCWDSFYRDKCDFFIHSINFGEDQCKRFHKSLKCMSKTDWNAGVGHQYQDYILPCSNCYGKYHDKVEDKRIIEFFEYLGRERLPSES